MTFEYAGEEYRITFKHDRLPLPTAPDIMVRGTRCLIGPEGAIRYVGCSYCHPSDNFCRETGRKIALKKALLWYDNELWRGFRTAAWKAYLGRSRGVPQEHFKYLDQLLNEKDLTEESVAKARQELERWSGGIRRKREAGE